MHINTGKLLIQVTNYVACSAGDVNNLFDRIYYSKPFLILWNKAEKS
jgi:hypothetical protein